MEIKFHIDDQLVEEVVRGIMENFPEASAGCALMCIDFNYDKWDFGFKDTETGALFDLDKEKLLAAFPLLFTNKWPRGCTQPPSINTDKEITKEEWDNWLCQADAMDFDAYVQLAIFQDVIYG